MLQKVAAEAMGLTEFDDVAFSEQVEEIYMVSADTLQFRFYDGREVTTTWESTARTDCWTPERRRLWESSTNAKKPTQQCTFITSSPVSYVADNVARIIAASQK